MLDRPTRIVIVGTGFAGVFAYLELHKRLHGSGKMHITLINPTDTFTFIPMIHEVAAGNLLPGSVTQALRTLPQCCIEDFIEGEVTTVDVKKKTLSVRRSLKDTEVSAHNIQELAYDYLIVATGSETNFFGVPGAEQYALPLKNLSDAVRIKNKVISSFERAQQLTEPEEVRAATTVVVVGGGPTGVEIAGELADLINYELSEAFSDVEEHARIIIIDKGNRLVRGIDPWFGKRVERILDNKRRVYTMLNTRVEEVDPHCITTSRGTLHTHMVIWSGGVTARDISFLPSSAVKRDDQTKRIRVNEHLQVPTHRDIFVVGDAAWVCDKEQGQPYPMRAQFAVREGRLAAENIVKSMRGQHLKEFYFKEKGFIVSLGKGGALAEIFNARLSGPLAWFIYRTVYLFTVVGWRAKLRMALEWTLNLFLPRDISKL